MVKAPGATLALRLLFLGLSRTHLTAVAWPTRTRLRKRFPAPPKEVIPCQVPAFDDRALRAARGCCRRRAAAQQCSGCAERDGAANLRWTAVSHSARSSSSYNAYSPRCRYKSLLPRRYSCVVYLSGGYGKRLDDGVPRASSRAGGSGDRARDAGLARARGRAARSVRGWLVAAARPPRRRARSNHVRTPPHVTRCSSWHVTSWHHFVRAAGVTLRSLQAAATIAIDILVVLLRLYPEYSRRGRLPRSLG